MSFRYQEDRREGHPWEARYQGWQNAQAYGQQGLHVDCTHLKEGKLNNLTELLDLLLASTNVRVRHRGTLLDLHHGNRRVDLRRQRNEDLVVRPVNTNAHSLLNVGGRDAVSKTNNELGHLLDRDDVAVTVGVASACSILRVEGLVVGRGVRYKSVSLLGVLLTGTDNGLASSDLERVLLLTLLVRGNIPQVGRRQSSVGLLDAHLLIDTLLDVLDVSFNLLQRERVGTLSVRLQDLDIGLIES